MLGSVCILTATCTQNSYILSFTRICWICFQAIHTQRVLCSHLLLKSLFVWRANFTRNKVLSLLLYMFVSCRYKFVWTCFCCYYCRCIHSFYIHSETFISYLYENRTTRPNDINALIIYGFWTELSGKKAYIEGAHFI